jgi:hypothetical protein
MVFDFTIANAIANAAHDLKIFNIRNPKTTTSCAVCNVKVTLMDNS